MGSYEMVNLLPRCDKNDHYPGLWLNGTHLGNRIYHFIGSNSLVVYCKFCILSWKQKGITIQQYSIENQKVIIAMIDFVQ